MDQSNFDQTTEAFLGWFKDLEGASFSDAIKISDLRDRKAGRGIVALQDIPPETVLFTIPRVNIIDVETSQLAKIIPRVFGLGDEDAAMEDEEEDSQLDSWSSLILIMIYEHFQGTNSPWKAYLDVLPSAFDTPMFWSDAELDELQASAMRGRIGKSEAEEMFRSKILPIVRSNSVAFPSSEGVRDEELITLAHRMGSTIMAYAFDLENDEERDEDEEDGWVEDRDGKSMMGMVPMADILNSDAEFNAHINHGEEALTATALRTIKAGEEILNYYGPHPNSELLRRYGYVTPKHARYDVVEIPWSVVAEITTTKLGLTSEILDKVNQRIDEDELEDSFVLERESQEPNSDGTFAGPATVSGPPPELHSQLKQFIKAVGKVAPETISDKRKRDESFVAIIDESLQSLQGRYQTSIAQDEELLATGNLSDRGRMALEVRLGEKRLLHEARLAIADSGSAEVNGQDDERPSKVQRS